MIQHQAAVIGDPVSHSLSPSIFSFLARRLGKSGFNYRAEKIESSCFGDFIQNVRAHENWIGLNVTIPHKESILKLLDQLSPEVQVIGAANVIHKKADLLIGYNTDVHGILGTLEKHQCLMEGKNALVLGAGGAARAIAYVLGCQKASQVVFLNRDIRRAEAFIHTIEKIFPATQFLAHPGLQSGGYGFPNRIDLWVNTTPVGMLGASTTREEQSASDYFTDICKTIEGSFSRNAYAFDLIYRPEETPFLSIAKKIGLNAMGGMEMLVEQALQTWRIWFGLTPELEDLKLELVDYLRHRPLFLTGFMGVGKSTVGPILAKKLGWNFLDIDLLIERETQMSIPEIFEKKGESAFREMESQIIQQHSFSTRTVIALGGGALSNPATRNTIENSGQMVFLSAQPDTLLKRLKTPLYRNHRPLLDPILAEKNSDHQKLKITTFLKQREKNYSMAKYQLETDQFSPEEIAQQIIREVK